MKEYYYVRNFETFGIITAQRNKKHLSNPKTEWDRYETRAEALRRLAEWGFVEKSQDSDNRYYPEGTFSN